MKWNKVKSYLVPWGSLILIIAAIYYLNVYGFWLIWKLHYEDRVDEKIERLEVRIEKLEKVASGETW